MLVPPQKPVRFTVIDVTTIEDELGEIVADVPTEQMENIQDAPRRLKPSEIATLIAEDCGLADALAGSVCLFCKKRVMVQTAKSEAVMYCQALNRDLDVCITRCTSFTPG
jgi:hypothetical protein